MELDVIRVKKYIDQLRERQEKAERNYHESGYDRYYNAMCRNQALADALEQVLKNKENTDTLNQLRQKIYAWEGRLENFDYTNYETRKEIVLEIIADIRQTAKFL